MTATAKRLRIPRNNIRLRCRGSRSLRAGRVVAVRMSLDNGGGGWIQANTMGTLGVIIEDDDFVPTTRFPITLKC